MVDRGNSTDFSWRTERTDPRDIRWAFALPRTEDDFKRMRENHNNDGWPPRFTAHKGYDSKFPVWGGMFNNKPMTTQTFTGDDFSDTGSESGGSTGSGSQPFKSKLTREPRVHHIPILVEARDDNSGYTFTPQREQPPAPVQKMFDQRSNYQSKPSATRSLSDQRVGSVQGSEYEMRKSNSQPPPAQGGFSTKVNVNVQRPTSAPTKEPPKKPQVPKVDPMKQIEEILNEMEDFKTKVENYKGITRDKDYRYLDEMLTRCMLKLDDVNTEGRDDIRLERKNAVRKIQGCIALLERRIVANQEAATRAEPGGDSPNIANPNSHSNPAETNGHHAKPTENNGHGNIADKQ